MGGRKKYISIKPSTYFFINLPLCRRRSPFAPSASIVNACPRVAVPPLPLHSSPPSPPPPLSLSPSPSSSSSSSQPTFPRRRHLCHHHHCCRRRRRFRHHNRRHRLRRPFHRCRRRRRRRRRRRCGCRRRKARSHRRCTSTAAATAKPRRCNTQQPPSATSELQRSVPQSSNATAAPPFHPHFHPFDCCVLIFLQKCRGVVDSNL